VTLYDLGSRHGTKLNKRDVPPRTHVRWRVGSLASFGESTRLLVLHGTESEAEDPGDADTDARRQAAKRVAALTAARRQRKAEEEAAVAAAAALGAAGHDVERDGITWSVCSPPPGQTGVRLRLGSPWVRGTGAWSRMPWMRT
jgi:hypothetical protein